MPWQPQTIITEEEMRAGLRGVTLDGIATKITLTLTGGVFFVAYALELGASNFVIGILAAIPFLTQIVQIPAVYAVEHLRNRRALSVAAASCNRIVILIMGLIPFVLPTEWFVSALVGLLVVQGCFGAVSRCAWSSWMRDLVPAAQRGSFYANRMSIAAAVGMVVALAAGYFVDWTKSSYPGHVIAAYSLLFVMAFIVGAVNVRIISGISEPEMKPATGQFLSLLARPFRDRNFRHLMRFLMSWHFAVNLAAPFFTVHMLKTLQLNMSTIVMLTVLSQLVNLAVLRIWGRFMDRYTNKSVLAVCAPLFMVCTFLWIFTAFPSRHMLTIPLLVLLHALIGISTAGTVLGTSNIAIRLAPKEAASAYLAASSLASSLAAGIAPVLGGLFADFFAVRHFSLTLRWSSPLSEVSVQTFKLEHWDFFFFFAFLIGCIAVLLLKGVREKGAVAPGVVMHEFFHEIGRNIRTLSTVGGLVTITMAPLNYMRIRMNNGGDESRQ